MIYRRLVCINNKGVEGCLTIGKAYSSCYDFIFDTFLIEELDDGKTYEILERKYFKIV